MGSVTSSALEGDASGGGGVEDGDSDEVGEARIASRSKGPPP